MQQELSEHNCKKCRLEVWQRGVDTDQFNPRFRCNEMRARMTDGHPDAPLLIHVGRLGAEKNLFVLKDMMARLPGARLAFVGDGPSRQQLQEHFADMPTVKFMVRPPPPTRALRCLAALAATSSRCACGCSCFHPCCCQRAPACASLHLCKLVLKLPVCANLSCRVQIANCLRLPVAV